MIASPLDKNELVGVWDQSSITHTRTYTSATSRTVCACRSRSTESSAVNAVAKANARGVLDSGSDPTSGSAVRASRQSTRATHDDVLYAATMMRSTFSTTHPRDDDARDDDARTRESTARRPSSSRDGIASIHRFAEDEIIKIIAPNPIRHTARASTTRDAPTTTAAVRPAPLTPLASSLGRSRRSTPTPLRLERLCRERRISPDASTRSVRQVATPERVSPTPRRRAKDGDGLEGAPSRRARGQRRRRRGDDSGTGGSWRVGTAAAAAVEPRTCLGTLRGDRALRPLSESWTRAWGCGGDGLACEAVEGWTRRAGGGRGEAHRVVVRFSGRNLHEYVAARTAEESARAAAYVERQANENLRCSEGEAMGTGLRLCSDQQPSWEPQQSRATETQRRGCSEPQQRSEARRRRIAAHSQNKRSRSDDRGERRARGIVRGGT